MEFFLGNINNLAIRVDEIVIRPHPSEPPNKHDWAIEAADVPLTIDKGSDLVDVILSAECVVGMDSMAMVVGLLAGKTVVCCIPPGPAACRLPHKDIQYLRDMSTPNTSLL